MTNGSKKIVVAGDVSVEVLHLPAADAQGGTRRFDWQRHPGVRVVREGGGAYLLARLLARELGAEYVCSYDPAAIQALTPAQALHRHLEIDVLSGRRHIARFLGNEGPDNLDRYPLELENDATDVAVVALNDGNNGFRDLEQAWPRALRDANARPHVIINMKPPLVEGPLWQRLAQDHLERTVVVIDADDLRELGANISRGLSWERTALTFETQIAENSALSNLEECAHLLVWFGLEGAIYRRRTAGHTESTLFYAPRSAEGETARAYSGRMLGATSAICAVLAIYVREHGLESLDEVVGDALRAARLLHAQGVKLHNEGGIESAAVSRARADDDDLVACVPIRCADEDWSILADVHQGRMADLAERIVIEGSGATSHRVPVGVFGAFETIDRSEVESFRSVGMLLGDYARKAAATKPLSIAVFGPPGSGKTFGVKQIAQSLRSAGVETGLQYNLSQWDSPGDLIGALHEVRDVVLEGSTPLVFFDEFDASEGPSALGWLKYFLAPMQQGQFRDHGAMHPVGKAIFVFAGGTSHSFADFSNTARSDATEFRKAKGPDFVSRLRGFIDIKGINKEAAADESYVIRRATKLRSLIERKFPALLIDGEVRIDPGVLRAFLTVPDYKHGVRSLEAVLEMSALRGKKLFDRASLPAQDQLELHTDSQAFLSLAEGD